MPRGVAIPEIRQHLFSAVERVIVRDGPGRLSGRAVTGEAGVATGLLHAHFTDLDDFLASYAVDRSFLVSAGASALSGRVGEGSVAANLCEAVLATPLDSVRPWARLLVARPDLTGSVRAVLGEGTAGFDAVERAVAAYLTAERRLGRVAAGTDPEALALALVGVVHHLVLSADTGPDAAQRLRATVTALIDGSAATAPR
ncbi:TetR/AcrR family transcriptional regulator [Nocardiopsis sp. NRRL B-16309]|uniref:TetR/AcrR family transcriptional regulator n=1 Tax=Nocardiopsis sp. NRRL B-16309 TaxID=1519494 RepID=UPI0006AF9446|nr:TetR/AcrR family transcriptional regulator [Nocardiopsis sp. NRRL B-16309]KOX13855.1 TetR family transcriptional regulator [Nocardiopsis sp. NRRL B-16309]